MKTIQMNKKKGLAVLMAFVLAIGLLAGCTQSTAQPEDTQADVSGLQNEYPDAHVIVLNEDGTATLDGETIEEFDYTWHADPSEVHDDVKNSPAEYYTGTEPDTDAAAYIAHDIVYYPELDTDAFVKQPLSV